MKHFILTGLLILAGAVSEAQQSDDCSEVVLTADENYMSAATVTSQASIGANGFTNNPSCYMHAASTMAQAVALQSGQAFHINPEEQYAEALRSATWVRDTTTGRTCNALNFLRRLMPDLPQCTNVDFVQGGHQLQAPEFFAASLERHFDGGVRVLPVGIEYCSGVLKHDENYITNRRFREGDLNYLGAEAASENFAEGCDFHSSVVVGRKRINGVCSYQIQNSFGSGCKAYPESRECEAGRIFVPVNQLTQNTFRLIFFRN